MLYKVIQCQECRKHFKKKQDPLMHLQKGHLLVYNWVSVHGKYAVQNGKKKIVNISVSRYQTICSQKQIHYIFILKKISFFG